MAEALGIAASVIAVIQLTTNVTKYCYKYISTVKTAPIQIEKMATELSALNILLQAIKTEITKGGGSPHTRSYQVALTAEIEKIFPQYEQELRVLLLKFDKRLSNVARRVLSRFTWPIKAGDIEREIERLQRYKDLFQFALTVDIAWEDD
ncbi:hypothetical protein DFP73DRAFT_286085 [Morchella snyderi]|nr:hypothetical protein DFP73DRAFT_286085 [Morchella snyderi]